MRSLGRNLLLIGFCFLAGDLMGQSKGAQPSVSMQVSSVEADPVFRKVFSPDRIEKVFHTSLINLTGPYLELQLDGKLGKIQIDQAKMRAKRGGGPSSNEPSDVSVTTGVCVPNLLDGSLREAPFSKLQLEGQILEERVSTSGLISVLSESGLFMRSGNRRDCLSGIYLKYYSWTIIRVRSEDWLEDFYLIQSRDGKELLAVGGIQIRPTPGEADAEVLLKNLRKSYGYASEGGLTNAFHEGHSVGSIWIKELEEDAPDPKEATQRPSMVRQPKAETDGLKKLWILPTWAPYIAKIQKEAREAWMELKRRSLGMASQSEVIEHLASEIRTTIQQTHDLEKASIAFNKLSWVIKPEERDRLQELDNMLIQAEQEEMARMRVAEKAAEVDPKVKEQLKEQSDKERARKNLCDWYASLDYLKKMVDQENKVQAASGITDMRKRYELGQSLVFADQLIKEGRATFRKLFHREFDRAKDCW